MKKGNQMGLIVIIIILVIFLFSMISYLNRTNNELDNIDKLSASWYKKKIDMCAMKTTKLRSESWSRMIFLPNKPKVNLQDGLDINCVVCIGGNNFADRDKDGMPDDCDKNPSSAKERGCAGELIARTNQCCLTNEVYKDDSNPDYDGMSYAAICKFIKEAQP